MTKRLVNTHSLEEAITSKYGDNLLTGKMSLAIAIGVTQQTVDRMLRGHAPSYSTAKFTALVLERELSELFPEIVLNAA